MWHVAQMQLNLKCHSYKNNNLTDRSSYVDCFILKVLLHLLLTNVIHKSVQFSCSYLHVRIFRQVLREAASFTSCDYFDVCEMTTLWRTEVGYSGHKLEALS